MRPWHPLSLQAQPLGRQRAFTAAFVGWLLDGYDFTVLTLVLLDVQRDLSIGPAAAGALGTATLLARLVGGVVAGRAADRYGRRPVLLASMLWFSIFSFVSGFAGSYVTLLATRTLFGLGMGGEWTAGSLLVLEHWPEHARGRVSGLLQGAFSWGFIVAALVFHLVSVQLALDPSWRWRFLLWIGIAPALGVFWLRRGVPESPIWQAAQDGRLSGVAARPLRWTAALVARVCRTTLVLGALMFGYQAMSFWYATLLRQHGREPLAHLVALNVGGIVGAAVWGALGASRLGYRGAIMTASATVVLALPLFLYAQSAWGLWIGALSIGLTGAGILGIAPAYIGAKFDTAHRGLGAGAVYHAATILGALAPYGLGAMQGSGWSLQAGMAATIGGAGALAFLLAWRGQDDSYSSA